MISLIFWLYFCFSSTRAFELKNLCGQLQEIDKNTINLPFENGQRWIPWENFPKAKVYTGNELTKAWKHIKTHQIKGLNETIDGLLNYFHLNQCTFFPFGGPARDLVLGQFPNDLDGVVTCEIPRLKDICDARYEPKQCRVILPDAKVLEIPPIENTDAKGLYLNGVDAIAWSYTYGQNGTGLEYTINSLGLYSDSDKVYLLDIVGSALQDLCERKIRIPVDQRDWGAWATFKRRKLYRFMKAQAAGFVTADRETFDFIIQSIMKTWETQRHDFKRFFCHHYLDGQYLLPEDLCIHPQLTNAKINKMQKYISALKSDLDLEFFQTKLKRAIEEMYNRKK